MQMLPVAQLENAKLLVRAPNWIGDAVMCLPALQELRRALPGASLTIVGRPWVLDIFAASDLGCRTIAYDTRKEQRGLLVRWRFATRLRREGFHAAILFQNAFDAALLAALARIPIRAGFARDARSVLLTHPVAVPTSGEIPAHETNYYLELLRRLGIISRLPLVDDIRLSQSARLPAQTKLDFASYLREKLPASGSAAERVVSGTFVVGINAGASFGTAKRWPGERFAELAARLGREAGTSSIFFGSGEEAALVETLLSASGDRAISLAGKTSLQDFIRLVPGCDLFITNDTGTMHVAAALGVPTLAIFGPTDEHGTRPLGPRSQVITGVAECRPCKLRHCPIDHRCMNSIPVETVFETARAILQQSADSRFVREQVRR